MTGEVGRRLARVGEALERTGEFGGVPAHEFERISRDHLIALLMDPVRLAPDDVVVDVGCGVMRAGVWIAHFLTGAEGGAYLGIEPHVGRRLAARALLRSMGAHIANAPDASGAPHIYLSDRSDFDLVEAARVLPAGRYPTVITALSVWSHAPKWAIEKMLDAMVSMASVRGLVASYFPTSIPANDYTGHTWVGRDSAQDTPGTIQHSEDWVVEVCEARGFHYNPLPFSTLGQQWVAITRAPWEGARREWPRLHRMMERGAAMDGEGKA